MIRVKREEERLCVLYESTIGAKIGEEQGCVLYQSLIIIKFPRKDGMYFMIVW